MYQGLRVVTGMWDNCIKWLQRELVTAMVRRVHLEVENCNWSHRSQREGGLPGTCLLPVLLHCPLHFHMARDRNTRGEGGDGSLRLEGECAVFPLTFAVFLFLESSLQLPCMASLFSLVAVTLPRVPNGPASVCFSFQIL